MARVTLALAVVASLAIAAPGARAAGGCQVARHAHVKATARHVVAYTVRRSEGRRDLYACLDGRGRRVKVEALPADARLGPVVAAGSKLAYAVIEDLGYPHYFPAGYASVRLLDLRHGDVARTLRSIQSDSRPPKIGRLVLAPDGALAYTTRWYYVDHFGDDFEPRQEVREVEAFDDLGYWPVAGGRGLALGSLERHGRVFTWTDAGERHSKRFRELGKCSLPRKAHVRAYARGVTVYVLAPSDGSVGGDAHACIATIGEDQVLHRYGANEDPTVFRIAGHFVAWDGTEWGAEGHGEDHVRGYDLDRHAQTLDAPVAPSHEECYEVRDLVASREGDVAWTTDGPPCGPGSESNRVTAWDACGRIELDDDPRVELYTLRRVGGGVVWDVGEESRDFEFRSAADC